MAGCLSTLPSGVTRHLVQAPGEQPGVVDSSNSSRDHSCGSSIWHWPPTQLGTCGLRHCAGAAVGEALGFGRRGTIVVAPTREVRGGKARVVSGDHSRAQIVARRAAVACATVRGDDCVAAGVRGRAAEARSASARTRHGARALTDVARADARWRPGASDPVFRDARASAQRDPNGNHRRWWTEKTEPRHCTTVCDGRALRNRCCVDVHGLIEWQLDSRVEDSISIGSQWIRPLLEIQVLCRSNQSGQSGPLNGRQAPL